MAAFQSGSLEMPEQGSILKLLEGLKNKSATKPADKKDAFIIKECNKIFKSRCLDRGYMHFTKKLALQAGIDCYPPDSEEADQSLKPHFPEQVLKELTATSHSRHIIIKGDFDNHRDNIKQLVASTAKPVSLLIADSNYGLNLGPWDVAWTSEFKNTLSLVDHCNDGLQNCKFIWFLTDQALPHAMAAISERDMQFKVFYWSKNRGNCAGDRFTSDGEIFLMCWPPGHQLDIFKDPTEPERYTTNPYCARIPSSNMFRLESTDVSKPTNSAQKPIALIRRILDFATEPGSLILDVTCGTGTTA
eukprot:jgi/Tetstr1/441200/TSEL_029456.t1